MSYLGVGGPGPAVADPPRSVRATDHESMNTADDRGRGLAAGRDFALMSYLDREV